MLYGIKRFLKKDGILIITTPNPWSKKRLKLIKSNKLEDKWLNKEHTCWFSFGTLKQLLDRSGFEKLFYEYYVRDSREEYFHSNNICLKKTKNILKNLRIKLTKTRNYSGLFFVCKLKS